MKCKMEFDGYNWVLRTSHNGYQWTALNINSIEEAKEIISVLQKHIKDQKEPKCQKTK